MSRDLLKRIAFGALVFGVGALGLYLYVRFVWYAGPTLAWRRGTRTTSC